MTEKPTYVIEEVTPERMALVDGLVRERIRSGEIFDNEGLKHGYACPRCGWTTLAVD